MSKGIDPRRSIVAVVLLASLFFIFRTSLAEDEAVQQTEPVLTNKDIIDMVSVGLDTNVVLAKIRRSAVSFDISTEKLIEMKKSGVPQEVLTAMIERPSGPGLLEPGVDPIRGGMTTSVVKEMKEIKTVLVRAPTEVLRNHAENILTKSNGLTVNTGGTGYDAVLIVGVDCGGEKWSFWSGAHFCTCQGSLSLESGGLKLWSTTESERSANAAKAGRNLVESMSKEFVGAWKKAQQEK